MSEAKQSFTLDEIATRWNCSHSSVLQLVYQGALRAVDISTNPNRRSRFVVFCDDLAAFEEARRTLPPAAPPKRRRVRIKPTEIVEFIR